MKKKLIKKKIWVGNRNLLIHFVVVLITKTKIKILKKISNKKLEKRRTSISRYVFRFVANSCAVPASELSQNAVLLIHRRALQHMMTVPSRCAWMPWRVDAHVNPVATSILLCTCRLKLKQRSHAQPRYGYFIQKEITKK